LKKFTQKMTRSTTTNGLSYAYVAKRGKASNNIVHDLSLIDVEALLELYNKDRIEQIRRERDLVLDAKDYDSRKHPRHVRCHDGKYRWILKFTCHMMLQEYWCCPECGCENSMDFDRCQHPFGCSFGFDNPEAWSNDGYDSYDSYDEN
ncbi:hypothetical protein YASMINEVIRUS_1588, partial [Yasminevirus sp. GU-2018]